MSEQNDYFKRSTVAELESDGATVYVRTSIALMKIAQIDGYEDEEQLIDILETRIELLEWKERLHKELQLAHGKIHEFNKKT